MLPRAAEQGAPGRAAQHLGLGLRWRQRLWPLLLLLLCELKGVLLALGGLAAVQRAAPLDL